MAGPSKLNLKIYQGATFLETLRWESAEKVYVPITGIAKSAPLVVTASTHNIVPGWRVKLYGMQGMKELNNLDYLQVTSVTLDTLTFNSINSINYNEYVSGGILEYNKPIDLTGYTAKMQIREKIESSTIIKELSTENNKIVIDTVNNTISINISANETAALNFTSAVYSLELTNAVGVVKPLVAGSVSLIKEVTR